MVDIADFLVRISNPEDNATVIYEGPRPEDLRDVDAVCPFDRTRSYIYMFTTDGWATYIGMTRDPGTRLRKHRRRSWFARTNGLVIVAVNRQRDWQARLSALHLEARAIRMFGPTENIAGGDSFGA